MDDDNRRQVNVQRIAPAYEQVAGQLRRLIVSGELSVGDRLPNETELGELFGVSRLTVREALKGLVSEGLIHTTRGVKGGSFVSQPATEDVAARLETGVGLLSAADIVSVHHLLEARAVVEVPAARFAAERHTDEQLARLRECVAAEQEVSSGFDRRLQLHEIVVEASGNPLLIILGSPVHRPLRTRFLRDEAEPEFWQQVHADHRDIVEAIASGDGDAAATAMHDHLDHLRRTYEAIDRLRSARADRS
jgi:DNA-binding FadR family transcriptional regulator